MYSFPVYSKIKKSHNEKAIIGMVGLSSETLKISFDHGFFIWSEVGI